MAAYELDHVTWLIAIAGASATLTYLCHRGAIPKPVVRVGLAIVLAGVEVERAWHDGLRFPDRMPFNLCNVSTWMAVLACATLASPAVEWAYFMGLSGSLLAVVMPDMGGHWPARFFISHGGTIVTVSVLIFGGLARLRPGAVWRFYRVLLGYAIFLGAFDWAYGTNYGFLCRKPEGVTPVNAMGPWPVYIVSGALVGLGVFWLMWIPLRRSAMGRA